MDNFIEFNIKKKSFYPKTVKFGVWDLKTSFEQFRSKRLKKL